MLRECVEIKSHKLLSSVDKKSAGGIADLESELGLDVLVKEAEGQDGEGGVAEVVH